MAYDLFITFAGLCMFRRPRVEEEARGGGSREDRRVEVLLPPTGAHAECCGDGRSGDHGAAGERVPGHFARLGYHARYDPTVTSAPGKRFREFDFTGKRLDLGSLGNPDSLNREFGHMDIVDLTDVVTGPLDPDCAIGQVIMKAGSLCPGAVCDHSRGARWKLAKKETQHMATLVTWRIRRVRELVRGAEGLELKVADLKSGEKEVCGILRPVDGQIRIYVFHTPWDELPSQGVPPFQTWTSGGLKPTEADHFKAYYELFPDHGDDAVPMFVDEGVDEDEEREAEAGTEAARSDGPAAVSPQPKAHLHLGFGRRYNCILTVVDDGGQG
ncbi:MAG TPA: hypothetical protein VFR81_22410 [Longimicrobium sp.]|nr:hypothetical protein [Longimicrobium sp.]